MSQTKNPREWAKLREWLEKVDTVLSDWERVKGEIK